MNKFLFGILSLAAAVSLQAKVYATVDGVDITEKDLMVFLQGMPPNMTVDELPIENVQQMVTRAVQNKLLAKESIAQNLQDSDLYKSALEAAKERLDIAALQEKVLSGVQVSDEEIQKFYDDNKAQMIQPAQVHVKHVLVQEKKDADAIVAQLSKLKGEDISKKISEIAVEKSIDPGAKQNGGDLGMLPIAQFVPEFGKAASELKDGEITKTPVKSNFGYHVIYRLGGSAEQTLPLDAVKADISNAVRAEKYRAEIEKLANDLVAKAKVEYKIDMNATSAAPAAAPAAK